MQAAHHIAGRAYVVKGDHRDGTLRKSQWIIPVQAELNSFQIALDQGWTLGDQAWSLHFVEENAQYLGTAAAVPGPADPLVVAIFELAKNCHGYPANHRRSAREKPPT